MDHDQELQEANERLLAKRSALNQTDSHTPRIENTDFKAIAEKCIRLGKERGNVVEFPEREYGEKPEPEPEKSWSGRWIGIPRLYADCTLDTYQGNDELVDDLRECRADGIVLRGATGCGKTHLAIAMTRGNAHARFVTVPDLLLRIRDSFNGGAESEREIITEYSEIPVLVLDDLGAEKTSEYSITTLYIILDRRIRDCRRTIITTNLTQDQIEETFGARIASRLAGMENIKINMPDRRKARK